MTKECDVLINDNYVTVVRFDDIEIQLPPIKENKKKIYIEKDSEGKYQIVDKPKKSAKKTTKKNKDESEMADENE